MTPPLGSGLDPLAVFTGETVKALGDQFPPDELIVGLDLQDQFITLGKIEAGDFQHFGLRRILAVPQHGAEHDGLELRPAMAVKEGMDLQLLCIEHGDRHGLLRHKYAFDIMEAHRFQLKGEAVGGFGVAGLQACKTLQDQTLPALVLLAGLKGGDAVQGGERAQIVPDMRRQIGDGDGAGNDLHTARALPINPQNACAKAPDISSQYRCRQIGGLPQ